MTDFPASSTYADLIRLARDEDLGPAGFDRDRDVTSALTVPAGMNGFATLYQKSPGVPAGLPIVADVCWSFDPALHVSLPSGMTMEQIEGVYSAEPMRPLLHIAGPMRAILSAERTLLNFVQRLSGIATLTRIYVDAVAGTRAKILDTRKTLPGFRLLDKYAVRAGGGTNHRMGLYDMVLIKDNHHAQLPQLSWEENLRALLEQSRKTNPDLPIEVEVVSVEKCAQVLAMPGVDVILLDNMPADAMHACVRLRDSIQSPIQLEASGGITLQNLRQAALSGVDRISIGALTHSVTAMDISLEIETG